MFENRRKKNNSLKSKLRSIVVRTNFRPFSWFYQLTYIVAIVSCRFFIGRKKEVRAIYLRRSAAAGDLLYGLSDIDLTVIISDGYKETDIKDRVWDTYKKLSLFFPMLGTDPAELGLYFDKEAETLYNLSIYHRYRTYLGRRQWKLLCGEDVISGFTELSLQEKKFCSLEEIKVWWSRCAALISADSIYHLKYLWYKAVAELGVIFYFIKSGKEIKSRQEIFKVLPGIVDGKYKEDIKNISTYRDKQNEPEVLGYDKLYEIFSYLSTCIIKSYRPRKLLRYRVEINYEYLDETLDLKNLNSKTRRQLLSDVSAFFSQDIQGVSIVPNLDNFYSLTNLCEPDLFCLFIRNSSSTSFEKVQQFTERKKDLFNKLWLTCYIGDDNTAFTFNGYGQQSCVLNKVHNPLFFILSNQLRETKINSGNYDFPERYILFMKRNLEYRINSLKGVIETGAANKLGEKGFFMLVYTLLRDILVLKGLGQGKILLFLSFLDLLSFAEKVFPNEKELLERIGYEYKNLLEFDKSQIFIYYTSSLKLLETL